jgi:hypothetical protein
METSHDNAHRRDGDLGARFAHDNAHRRAMEISVHGSRTTTRTVAMEELCVEHFQRPERKVF